MNKSAYLTAMNVTTWRVRDTKVKPYLIILDEQGELPEAEPLIDAVLKLIDIKREECDFDYEAHTGKQIIWDLRRHKVRPRTAWLVSEPLAILVGSWQAKSALWQQIYQWRDQVSGQSPSKS
ncbi:MAG: DNA polymerase III subunit psi [Shewanella sp.]